MTPPVPVPLKAGIRITFWVTGSGTQLTINHLAKILDAFQTNNPGIFAIVQIFLLTGFRMLTYGGCALGPTLQTILLMITVAEPVPSLDALCVGWVRIPYQRSDLIPKSVAT